MEENQHILSGDAQSLTQYRELLVLHEQTKRKRDETALEAKRIEKELNLSKKTLKDNTESTVKKRRQEVALKFDSEIEKENEKLKKVRTERMKAKEKGVKERIMEETSDLHAQNRELKKNIRRELKAEKLPSFCGGGFYFTLYFTKGPGEILICALMIVLLFLLLPGGIYLLLSHTTRLTEKIPEAVQLAVVYFAIAVILFFIYKLIGDQTKHKHHEKLNEIRLLRDRIAGNKKQIRKIARSIRRDKNEEMYGLDDFDLKIRDAEAACANIEAEKQKALRTFDEVTAPAIVSEMEGREMPHIEELESDYQNSLKEKELLERSVKETGITISTDYEAYLGKEYTVPSKVDELIAVMQEGEAATVADAVNLLKEKNQR